MATISKWVLTPFLSYGTPATGLTPEITITDVSDGTVVVNKDDMVELSNGQYKYEFTSFEVGKNYAFFIDAGDTLQDGERYAYGGSDDFVDELSYLIQQGLPTISFEP